MNHKTLPLFALLILAIATLSCSPCGLLGGRGGRDLLPTVTPTSSPLPTATSTPTMEPPSPTEPPPPTETPVPSPAAGAGIGEGVSQWAASATASSEYGNPDWAATQATGAPDTVECGDHPTAWASAGSDTIEWIELTYNFPVLPTQVNIFQTHSPDQVVKVELIDPMGTQYEIYTGEPEDRGEECPYTLSIPVENARYQVYVVRITIDQSVIPGPWNEIDAVELVGIPEHPIMLDD